MDGTEELKEELQAWDTLSDEALSKFTEMLYSDSVFIQDQKETQPFRIRELRTIKDMWYGIKEKL